MEKILEQLGLHGLIPVIKLDDASDALPLAGALRGAGLPAAEITFRTDAALPSIKAISGAYPDMLLGAGTVLTIDQASAAADAGAKFIVSPGFNPAVAGWCVKNNIPVVPGCSTPTDIEAALGLGLGTVKFFPAEAAGGVQMLKALSAPYSGVRFIPTGGINESNLVDYLSAKNVLACGGSYMIDGSALAAKDYGAVETRIKKAVNGMYGFSLAHIGINLKDSCEAKLAAELSEKMFGFAPEDGALGIMCSKQLEFMKGPYFGSYGHIAVATRFIERAMEYFKRMGFEFEEDGILYNAEGRINAAYFKKNFFGCAVHLLRKA